MSKIVKRYLTNDRIVLITENGTIMDTAHNGTVKAEEFLQFSNEEIIQLFFTEFNSYLKQNEEIKKANELTAKMRNEFASLPNIVLEDDKFFFKGIPVSLPQIIVEKIYDAYTNNNFAYLRALENFWFWLSRNPDPVARQGLMLFVEANEYTITPQGMLVAARWVREKTTGIEGEERKKYEFVMSTYDKLLRWKLDPTHYGVEKTEDGYKRVEINHPKDSIYVLRQQYLENPKSIVYTDNHSRSTTIKFGEPVKMDRKDCDADPSNTCSRGLHVTSTTRLQDHASYAGNVSIAVLINPMNVVAVPTAYNNAKMRVCEYLPVSILSDYDQNDLDLYDEEYFDLNMEEFQSIKVGRDVQFSCSFEMKKLLDNPTVSNLYTSIPEYVDQAGVYKAYDDINLDWDDDDDDYDDDYEDDDYDWEYDYD